MQQQITKLHSSHKNVLLLGQRQHRAATCFDSIKFRMAIISQRVASVPNPGKANLTMVFGLWCRCPQMGSTQAFSVSVVNLKHSPCYKISNIAIYAQTLPMYHRIIYVEEKIKAYLYYCLLKIPHYVHKYRKKSEHQRKSTIQSKYLWCPANNKNNTTMAVLQRSNSQVTNMENNMDISSKGNLSWQ